MLKNLLIKMIIAMMAINEGSSVEGLTKESDPDVRITKSHIIAHLPMEEWESPIKNDEGYTVFYEDKHYPHERRIAYKVFNLDES